MEKYNKYHESLDIDCGCKESPKPKKSSNCCGGISLPSHDNEIEILIRQLKNEVNKLMKTTEAKLLCQDKKIAETMVYIKNNLSNALRLLLNSMLESGQLEDLITGVVSNAIEVLENDVSELQADMLQVKAQTTANSNDIINLKGKKVEFTEYENTSIDSTFQNIEISHDYYNDSLIYITKLKNIDKLSCLPTNGNPSADIYEGRTNVITYAKAHNDYKVYMNCGFSGMCIFDGIVNNTNPLHSAYYCGFTEDNEMKFYNALDNEITSSYLISEGIVNCFPGASPIIENGNVYDYTEITSKADTSDIARDFRDYLIKRHPRQLIANDYEGNFYIISIFGRTPFSIGLTYDEMQTYFSSKGYKNVFNCDGGGSTQTVINQENLIYPPQDIGDNYRIVPTILGFKLKGVE